MVKLKVLPGDDHSSTWAWLFFGFWINFIYLNAILSNEKCILVWSFFPSFFFPPSLFLQLWMLLSKSDFSVLV